MKLRELIAWAAAAIGLGLAIWTYRSANRSPRVPPAQPGQGGGGDELDSSVHGEFIGPDNPPTATEMWYEKKAEEIIETADTEAATPDELAKLLVIKYPKADPAEAEAYIEQALE